MTRVPISPGFAISFANDGRPLSHGKSDGHAVEYLQDWLEENDSDERSEKIRHWLELKIQQLAEAASERSVLVRRENAEAQIENAIRKGNFAGSGPPCFGSTPT